MGEKMIALRYCPNPSCRREPIGDGTDGAYFISCPSCGMSGPAGMTGADAVEAWNNLPRFNTVSREEIEAGLNAIRGIITPADLMGATFADLMPTDAVRAFIQGLEADLRQEIYYAEINRKSLARVVALLRYLLENPNSEEARRQAARFLGEK